MKKTISLLLSIIILTSICLSGHALNNNEVQPIYIPSPAEIQEQYDNTVLFSIQSEGLMSDYLVSPTPLLNLGILAGIAETHNDFSVLEKSSEIVMNDILPSFQTEHYMTILQNYDYTEAFRCAIIDMYSYLPTLSTQKSHPNVDTVQVDEALINYIAPENKLSIMAIAAIQDKSLIDASRLTSLFSLGSESEQKVALRTLCQEYPDIARSLVQDILEQGYNGSELYLSAINFMPRLINASTDFTTEYVILEIENILNEYDSQAIQYICMTSLLEIDSPEVLDMLNRVARSLPADVVNYYADTSSQSGAQTLNRPEIRGLSMRKGNALYRDGVMMGPIEINWHTGLVAHENGPLFQNKAYVIHHRGKTDPSYVVQYDTFTTFRDGQNFINECYLSGVSDTTYNKIFATANQLVAEAIPYTFFALLTFNSPTGKINPQNITAIRCDGVVEYCYEYNGVRLQGDNVSWDISTSYGQAHHNFLDMSPKTQYDYFDRTVPYD